MELILTHLVSRDEDGMRLGQVLRQKMGLSSRQISRAKFTPGGIRLDGLTYAEDGRTSTGTIVRQGQTIRVCFPDGGATVEEDRSGLKVPVLYEDRDLVFLSKPAGMPVHPSGDHASGTLANILAARYPEPVRLIGRLDMDTSGVIGACRSSVALTRMEKERKEGVYHKEYVALVHGWLEGTGVIDTPLVRVKCPDLLGKSGHPMSLMLAVSDPRAQQALKKGIIVSGTRSTAAASEGYQAESAVLTAYTAYEVLRNFNLPDGSPASFVRLDIRTGRMHQIRTHMAFIGHPLLFDGLYGQVQTHKFGQVHPQAVGQVHPHADGQTNRAAEGGIGPGRQRCMLHAMTVTFDQPMTGERRTVRAPLPEDFQALLG